jgi:hypothetical protein
VTARKAVAAVTGAHAVMPEVEAAEAVTVDRAGMAAEAEAVIVDRAGIIAAAEADETAIVGRVIMTGSRRLPARKRKLNNNIISNSRVARANSAMDINIVTVNADAITEAAVVNNGARDKIAAADAIKADLGGIIVTAAAADKIATIAAAASTGTVRAVVNIVRAVSNAIKADSVLSRALQCRPHRRQELAPR